MQSKYDSYAESTGSGDQDFDDIELIVSVHSSVVADSIDRFFGTESEYGQSVGVVLENPRLEDGALYLDQDKGKLKSFSWSSVVGRNPIEYLEAKDEPLHAEDADEELVKEYFGETKTYDLIAARVPEIENDDGEVVTESSAIYRDWTLDGDFGDFEDIGDDMPAIAPETISWYSGNKETGPSVPATRLVQLLGGQQYLDDEDDLFNFLTDTSGDNILRDDVDGRPVRFFLTRRSSDDSGYDYNYVVIEDVELDEPITVENSEGN